MRDANLRTEAFLNIRHAFFGFDSPIVRTNAELYALAVLPSDAFDVGVEEVADRVRVELSERAGPAVDNALVPGELVPYVSK